MENSEQDFAENSAPSLTIRPTLHSVEQVVHALVPYYGPNHPVAAISTDPRYAESCIRARLGSIASMLAGDDAFARPLLVIR